MTKGQHSYSQDSNEDKQADRQTHRQRHRQRQRQREGIRGKELMKSAIDVGKFDRIYVVRSKVVEVPF